MAQTATTQLRFAAEVGGRLNAPLKRPPPTRSKTSTPFSGRISVTNLNLLAVVQVDTWRKIETCCYVFELFKQKWKQTNMMRFHWWNVFAICIECVKHHFSVWFDVNRCIFTKICTNFFTFSFSVTLTFDLWPNLKFLWLADFVWHGTDRRTECTVLYGLLQGGSRKKPRPSSVSICKLSWYSATLIMIFNGTNARSW